MPATPTEIDPRSPLSSQIVALLDRTTADDGRTRRFQQLLTLAAVLVLAVVVGAGCILLGLGADTGVAGTAATLVLGGGGAVGAQRVARGAAARRAARNAAGAPEARHDTPINPVTEPFPLPTAGSSGP